MAPVEVLAVGGPTASGKTAVSIALARALGAEIVCADSVQVYRGLDIGSAKPTLEERAGVPHHLLDVADPTERYDAGRYARDASACVAEIQERGRAVIVCGGTGLYLRSLLRGLAEDIPRVPEIRARLDEEARRGPEALRALHATLATVDPETAARVHPTDPIRIVRALEVWEATGEPISRHHARHRTQPPRYRAEFVCLDVPRAQDRERVIPRTDAMLARGWVSEVRALLDAGTPPDAHALSTVGYREVVDHLTQGVSLDETRERIVGATTAFAKRQRTWFRGEPGVRWMPPGEAGGAAFIAEMRSRLLYARR